MSKVQKVEADVRVSTQHGTLTFAVVGTGSGVEGLDQLGAYIGGKVHEEVSKIVGFDVWNQRIADAQSEAQAARLAAEQAKQALKDERAIAEQERLAKVSSKRAT